MASATALMGTVIERVMIIEHAIPTTKPMISAMTMIILELNTMPVTLALLSLEFFQASFYAVWALAITVSPMVFIWGRMTWRN